MYLIFLLLFSVSSYAWDLVAHRGVHHTYGDAIQNGCRKFINQRHNFIENTIPSIKKAFDYGADRVEIDLVASKDGKVFLFHDDRFNCLGLPKKVEELTWSEIQNINPGAGITFDGKTYPFKTSTLRYVLWEDVIRMFPNKKFLINPKNDSDHLIHAINRVIERTPIERRRELWFWGKQEAFQKIQSKFPELVHFVEGPTQYQDCLDDYFSSGWLEFPDSCKGRHLSVGFHQWWMIWDWPFPFLNKAETFGTKVSLYLANQTHEVSTYSSWPLESVIVSNIDLIKRRKND